MIVVENVSKMYRLGQVGTGTISNDLKRWLYMLGGKEDPFLQVGQSNDRSSTKGTLDYVWSLKDINFEVKQGEVLGIIGRNGAGKSTLLKVLSKITAPTTGRITIEGRVASLLEVGTGFHPELTGRENIFLNGTILGMNKAEVNSKLEEIVEFSGVAKYLDTPVKRYSSGMLVRLGFAVAAHLEPEILIVDEVLAVGDVEFQKKCLGKMKDVSKAGRTVLFVSHNMSAMKNLCDRAILLDKGKIVSMGSADKIVDEYLFKDIEVNNFVNDKIINAKNDVFDFHSVKVVSSDKDTIFLTSKVNIESRFRFHIPSEAYFSIALLDLYGEVVFGFATKTQIINAGLADVSFEIPENLLNSKNYSIRIIVNIANQKSGNVFDNVLNIRVQENQVRDNGWYGDWAGVVRPIINYKIHN